VDFKESNSRWVLLLGPREHWNEEGLSSPAEHLFDSQAIAVYNMPVRSMTQVSVVHCVEPDCVRWFHLCCHYKAVSLYASKYARQVLMMLTTRTTVVVDVCWKLTDGRRIVLLWLLCRNVGGSTYTMEASVNMYQIAWRHVQENWSSENMAKLSQVFGNGNDKDYLEICTKGRNNLYAAFGFRNFHSHLGHTWCNLVDFCFNKK